MIASRVIYLRFLEPLHSVESNQFGLFSNCNASCSIGCIFRRISVWNLIETQYLLLRAAFFSRIFDWAGVCFDCVPSSTCVSLFGPCEHMKERMRSPSSFLPSLERSNMRAYAQNAKWTRAVRYYVCNLTQTDRPTQVSGICIVVTLLLLFTLFKSNSMPKETDRHLIYSALRTQKKNTVLGIH